MAVSVEVLEGLERKVNVLLPSDKIESEVGSRLKNIAGRTKIDGFRPGKAPFQLVKKRYSDDVRLEVIRDFLQPSLHDALKEQALVPVASPRIDPGPIEANKDFGYAAIFEVFPEFNITPLGESKIELIQSEVVDKDVDATIEKLREQHKTWSDVSRKAKDGDKLIVDFDLYEGDELIAEQGEARNFEIILGQGNVLPALEKALIGVEINKQDDYTVDFPADWHDASFAGRTLTFKLTVHQILEGTLPAIDDELAKTLNVKKGGVKALKEDVKGHMKRVLERRVNELNRETTFDVFLNLNTFDLPVSLIDEEIKHLQHDFYHEVFGSEHSDDEKIPDFPRNLFEERAIRRVHLGLLFAEYVKQENITADDEGITAMIEKAAESYDDPDEVRKWYRDDSKRMAEVEALVIEERAAEKLIKNAKVTNKAMDYEAVMNPPAPEMAEGDANDNTGE
ncbi:MAG: trigger factor [Gammaproteobacteria bacterium]|nr:trigger factor [Gammaproteobacteria bacterium]MCH9763656.1 trigger factor [Gammaproteobacteria bacterium]